MNSINKPVQYGFCPDCHSRVIFHKAPELFQLITCRECGELLEVVQCSPLKIDWAFKDKDEDEQFD